MIWYLMSFLICVTTPKTKNIKSEIYKNSFPGVFETFYQKPSWAFLYWTSTVDLQLAPTKGPKMDPWTLRIMDFRLCLVSRFPRVYPTSIPPPKKKSRVLSYISKKKVAPCCIWAPHFKQTPDQNRRSFRLESPFPHFQNRIDIATSDV